MAQLLWRRVAVLCTVVLHEPAVDEVEAVRAGLMRACDQGGLPLLVQRGLRVDHLPGVPG
eukprot:CAMPEP_0179321456 /NCGR_PEP_ID=MMETSP0797-20121207/58625_1 /TAXON_ID=47934 /ORGANISM="Dinophysis acuminata, Strain DAEP01" /LENGTH=59 /DNA_ID=CAMNT_0021033089 /DNA_START=71 /DNA_END=247 /DNA_ORIENTATION=+